VDIISKLKDGDKTEISPRNSIADRTTGRPWPARSIRDRVCRTKSPALHAARLQSTEARLCGISAELSAGARYIGCERIMGCEAALPHRAERGCRPAYCLLPAACRLMSRAPQPAIDVNTAGGRGHWHGTATTNIWERCTGGYRKSESGAWQCWPAGSGGQGGASHGAR